MIKGKKKVGRYDEHRQMRWFEFQTMIFVGSRFNRQHKKRQLKRARALARR